MKYSIPSLLATLSLFLGFSPDTNAQGWPSAATGLKLEIAPAPVGGVNSNTISVDASGAIGAGNVVTGYNSLAIGSANYLSGVGSLSVGTSNNLTAPNSASIGLSNVATNPYSLTVGWSNANWSESSLIVGGNNATGNAVFSATIGYGLASNWAYCTLLGSYNNQKLRLATSWPLFVVGCGPSTQDRRNAIEVYADGKVILNNAQGDILMGEFGN